MDVHFLFWTYVVNYGLWSKIWTTLKKEFGEFSIEFEKGERTKYEGKPAWDNNRQTTENVSHSIRNDRPSQLASQEIL